MTAPPEKIPLEEIKKLSKQAFDENIDLMSALAEYDMRGFKLPENFNMRTITFNRYGLSGEFRISVAGEGPNEAIGSQTQNHFTLWTSSSISSQTTTSNSRRNTVDLLSEASQ